MERVQKIVGQERSHWQLRGLAGAVQRKHRHQQVEPELVVQHLGAEPCEVRVGAARPEAVQTDQPGPLRVTVTSCPGVSDVIAFVVVPPAARRVVRRSGVAALEREPFKSHRRMPCGLDRRRQERRRGGVKRARRRGPTGAIKSVCRGDLLADSRQVAGTGVAMRPPHRCEEKPIDRASGETGEAGVGIASREADAGGGRFRFGARGFAFATARSLD